MRSFAIALAAGLLAVPALAGAAKTDPQQRISSAFQDLGMPDQQSVCYGKVIVAKLGPTGGGVAANIVETSKDAQEVRANVKNGGVDMVQAFLAARTECGE